MYTSNSNITKFSKKSGKRTFDDQSSFTERHTKKTHNRGSRRIKRDISLIW